MRLSPETLAQHAREARLRFQHATLGPACSSCNDAHWVDIEGYGREMCTRCPLPCDRCRGHLSAYCKQTPCDCDCHTRKEAR